VSPLVLRTVVAVVLSILAVVAVAVGVAAILVAPRPPFPTPAAWGEPPGQPRGMVVGGSATLEAVPDVADVRATLSVEAPSPVEATREVRERQRAAAGGLSAAGVSGTDVSLSHLGLDPVTDRHTGAIVGYRASIDLIIAVRDFDRLAPLLETLGKQGATTVSTSFRVSDLPALKARVRRDAAAAAQKKARDLAAALGVELGAVRAVTETPGDGWTWNGAYANYVARESVPGGTHGNLQPISLTINVTYDLG
jgi:uncharacterized protein YggE